MCIMTLNKNQTIKKKFKIYFGFRSIMYPMTLKENSLGFQMAYL